MKPIITFALTAVLAFMFASNAEYVSSPADEIWAFHDEYIDFEGNVTRIDQVEYDVIELDARYREEKDDNYVKSFKTIVNNLPL